MLDNFSNSCEKGLERVEEISGKPIKKILKVDILDKVVICVCVCVCVCV